jgi:hypothetical protein
MSKKARDVMTGGAECIGENETLVEAARKMKELDVGAMPICGDDPAAPAPAISLRASPSRSAPTTPSRRRCTRWPSTRFAACR